jgi:uncharacterized protein YuzE
VSVTIGSHTFDRVRYDEEADVLYLHKGDGLSDADWDATPEGHGLSFNAEGMLVGMTIVSPRKLVERSGTVEITLPPEHIGLSAEALNRALIAA